MRSHSRLFWLGVPLLLALVACSSSNSSESASNPYLLGPQPWSNLNASASSSLPSGELFLSDLAWTSAQSGWGPIEKDRSNGENKAGDGKTLTLGKTTYAKGLGMHSNAEVVYNLGGNCSSLISEVGLDSEVKASTPGSVVFRVLGDGQELYNSGVLRGSGASKHLEVKLTGVQQLTLQVGDAGDGVSYDHADWAAAKLSCAAPGAGTGLKGEYFNTRDLSGPATERTDPTVNFAWGDGSPLAGINNDQFSVRWSGQVTPLYGESYTFSTTSDDGVRLWVNGKPLVDNWTEHAPTEDRGQIVLEAGKKYDLKLEYFEGTGLSSSKLEWESAHQTRQVVPQSQLFPAAVTPPPACVGVVVTPASDLRALASSSPEGTTFCLKRGLYRELSVIPRARQSFIGEPGTLLSGARVLSSWVQEGGLWRVGGQTQQGQVHANDQCQAGHPRCGYPEDLFLDDQPLLHVDSKAGVRAGTWFFDYDQDTIYLGSDPTGHLLETSVSRNAFAGPQNGDPLASPSISGVLLEGLTIEKYAIPAQMGAVGDQFPSREWTIRNCEVRLNHGMGIRLGEASKALGNHVHHNGHAAMGGGGYEIGSSASGYQTILAKNIVVEDNELDHNNTAGFIYDWEGGASKFGYTSGLVYRHNSVHDNFGMGIWTDTDNVGSLVENNTVEGNDGVGIMHEISYDAIIRNNTVRNNGLKGDYVFSAGILISSSSRVEVYGNTVEVGATSGQAKVFPMTRMGMVVFQANVGLGNLGQHVSQHNHIYSNTVTYLAPEQLLDAGAGISRTGVLSDGNSQALLDNTFEGNTYQMPDCAQGRWNWVTPGPQNGGTGEAHAYTFADFQKAGFERTGSCRTG